MTDILIVSIISVLLIVSIWLYLSLEKVNSDLDIYASLYPQPLIRGYLLPRTTKFQQFLKRIQEIKPNILSWFSILTKRRYRPSHRHSSMHTASGRPSSDAIADISKYDKMIRYYGLARIPHKVYQGDSYNITLTLNSSVRSRANNEQPIKISRQGDNINLTLTVSSKDKEYLEIEIMAAGFSVDGDKKQRQLLASGTLQYQWNCFFEKSGAHSFTFVFRILASSGETLQIGRVEQTIKVVQIDHLTQRQVWILATSAGVLSGILTTAEILRNLGVW